MATISDTIEKFIKDLMSNEKKIQIQRNELANLFSCVPSQINYVLTTRFTIERGYLVESKKGGGGYVQIIKIEQDDIDLNNFLNNQIGDRISYRKSKDILEYLREQNIINDREEILILSGLEDKVLSFPNIDLKERVRANILKNIIKALII
ncbi:MAG: CtsR family transcriptional regulator [Clostridioides sp.]|jgi:transcriptional regulator CtsR|nr:CtsR family transcriptional regulator [Clostridioides sp.]